MPKVPEFTHTELLAHLHYNQDTGEFTRLVKTAIRHEVGDRADYPNKLGYRLVGFNRSGPILAHRLAVFYMTGEWPVSKVDHKDGNPGNNAWANLRPATHKQNMRNCKKHRGGNPLKGAFYDKRRKINPWRAQIRVDGRTYYLGCFATAEDAHAAYCATAKKIHGEFFNAG